VGHDFDLDITTGSHFENSAAIKRCRTDFARLHPAKKNAPRLCRNSVSAADQGQKAHLD